MTKSERDHVIRQLTREGAQAVADATYNAAQAWPGHTYRAVMAAATTAQEVALIANGALRVLGRDPGRSIITGLPWSK